MSTYRVNYLFTDVNKIGFPHKFRKLFTLTPNHCQHQQHPKTPVNTYRPEKPQNRATENSVNSSAKFGWEEI
jgi:hypothetical protein